MTKKKIGIFTWWGWGNYGAFLQAFATVRCLEQLNYKPELVIFNDQSVNKSKIKAFIHRMLICFTSDVFSIYARKRKWQKATKELPYSYVALTSPPYAVLRKYDILLSGSDQIWNPDWIIHKICLLGGAPNHIPRISYASSIAKTSIPENLQMLYRDSLEKFNAISVREKTGVKILKDIIKKDVKNVVDPTLLFSASEWVELLKLKQNKKSNSIVAYLLSSGGDICFDLLKAAKYYGTKICLYTGATSPIYLRKFRKHNILNNFLWIFYLIFSRRIKICKKASHAEFVSAICNSKYVFTDSFHGLMFSTIFGKNVKLFLPQSRSCMNSRINDFLGKIDAKNVIVDECVCNVFDVNSSFDHDKLDAWIDESKNWLKNALKSCK